MIAPSDTTSGCTQFLSVEHTREINTVVSSRYPLRSVRHSDESRRVDYSSITTVTTHSCILLFTNFSECVCLCGFYVHGACTRVSVLIHLDMEALCVAFNV